MEQNYDSRQDTLDHIERVKQLLDDFIYVIRDRGQVHDHSKLEEPEKSAFDEFTPQLRNLTFGSPEYKESLAHLQVALDHHYAHNSHHPQYYKDGINGMNLVDIVEMFMDWVAAGERTKNGSIHKSIEINKDRFEITDQLSKIFTNTANYFGIK